VYGAVLNINRGNPGDFEVAVDSWPNFGAILARCRKEVGTRDISGGTPRLLFTGTWVLTGSCWRPPGACTGTEPSTSLVGMGGTGRGLLGRTGKLDPSIQVGSLNQTHLDLLNQTWPYGGNSRSRQYLGELLSTFPNLCLQDGTTGQPLSWVLTDPFGTGTHAYTLPAHRRHGYMRTCLTLAAKQAQTRGFPSFG
ncbi:Glycine N-acyltransferase-like 3, partial [Calypte anna]